MKSKLGTELVVVLLLIAAVTGCTQQRDANDKGSPDSTWVYSQQHLVTMENGCKLDKITAKDLSSTIGSGPIYAIFCPAHNVVAQTGCGKSQCGASTALTPEESARNAALAKLSDEDRKALGIK